MNPTPLPPVADRAAPTPGRPEKEAVRAMFDRIAPRYDLLNRVLSAGTDGRWRRACIDRLGLPARARLLDVATGTADVLIEWLGRGAPRSGVGVDLAGEMVSRGRAKLDRPGMSGRGGLLVGDAERLPLASGSADGATIAFGIRNVGDPLAALEEIRRVLRPGGVLVVLEFSMPAGLLGRGYRFYFTRVLPRVGSLVSGHGKAYEYLPASVARFPDPPSFAALLRQAGFVAPEASPLTGGIAHLYRAVRS